MIQLLIASNKKLKLLLSNVHLILDIFELTKVFLTCVQYYPLFSETADILDSSYTNYLQNVSFTAYFNYF